MVRLPTAHYSLITPMSDQELEKKLETYQQVAKENPNVDVSMLMMNALQNENESVSKNKSYKWPYLISVSLPPVGLFFAAKYYFWGDGNENQPALICVLLTVFAIVIFFAFGGLLLSNSGTSVDQIYNSRSSLLQNAQETLQP